MELSSSMDGGKVHLRTGKHRAEQKLLISSDRAMLLRSPQLPPLSLRALPIPSALPTATDALQARQKKIIASWISPAATTRGNTHYK
jgi:hypothetical protein